MADIPWDDILQETQRERVDRDITEYTEKGNDATVVMNFRTSQSQSQSVNQPASQSVSWCIAPTEAADASEKVTAPRPLAAIL